MQRQGKQCPKGDEDTLDAVAVAPHGGVIRQWNDEAKQCPKGDEDALEAVTVAPHSGVIN